MLLLYQNLKYSKSHIHEKIVSTYITFISQIVKRHIYIPFTLKKILEMQEIFLQFIKKQILRQNFTPLQKISFLKSMHYT